MDKNQIVRVKPKAFDSDWKADLQAIGIIIPKEYSVLQYSPVGHNPMPFSMEIDISAKRLVQKIVGVMPNALYRGHIYSWDEFCEMLRESK